MEGTFQFELFELPGAADANARPLELLACFSNCRSNFECENWIPFWISPFGSSILDLLQTLIELCSLSGLDCRCASTPSYTLSSTPSSTLGSNSRSKLEKFKTKSKL